MFYVIKVSTVTRAQHTIFVLKQYGIKGSIVRLKNPKREEGCGYAVKLSSNDLNRALEILDSNAISYSGVDEA